MPATRCSRCSTSAVSKKLHIDLKAPKPAEGLFCIGLGEYDCGNYTAITISNIGADGYVVVDGARWLPVEE